MLVTYIVKVACYSITFAKRLIWSSEMVLLVLPGVLVGSEPSASTLGQTFKSCIPCRNILQGKMQNHFSKCKIIQLSEIKFQQQLQEHEVASFAKTSNLHNWTLLQKCLAPCILYSLYFTGTWSSDENCEVRDNTFVKWKRNGSFPKSVGCYKYKLRRKFDLHSFIICNEAESIPPDLQIVTVTLGLSVLKKKNQQTT